MYVPPRSGLHSWWQPSHWSRSTSVLTSMTSQSWVNDRPYMCAPMDARVRLLAPSAQHIVCLHALLTAAHPVQEAHPHPTVLGLGDRGDLHVAVDGDLRVALDVRAEHGFQLGLVEHVHLRESVGGADLCAAR